MSAALRLAAAIAFAIPALSSAQAPPAYGCDTPESRQFDFWLGDWELTHSGGKSANRISKSLDGCVIVEQFAGAPGTKLDGTSVSTYDKASGRWKQTWVDNTGAYLDFVAGEDNGGRTWTTAWEIDYRRAK